MRARMAYCGPRGIPLSRFLSWPVDDQQAALTWMAEDRLRCSNCGTAEWEWDEDPEAYEAQMWVCKGCNRIGTQQKNSDKQAEAFPGLKIHLVAREAGRGSS
jgi:hypothetical protein